MQKNKGISLLEIILALAVIGVICVIAVRYFFIASNNLRVTRAVAQIQQLSKASYEWLQVKEQADFGAEDSAISVDHLWDAGLITAQDKKDPWGGKVRVAPGSNPVDLAITLTHVPEKACLALRQKMKKIAREQTPEDACNLETYNIEM